MVQLEALTKGDNDWLALVDKLGLKLGEKPNWGAPGCQSTTLFLWNLQVETKDSCNHALLVYNFIIFLHSSRREREFLYLSLTQ